MGNRTTQRILTCGVCGKTPDDGDYMWEMGNAPWCEPCCDSDKKEDCPQCGEETETLHEGCCEDCREDNQKAVPDPDHEWEIKSGE